MSQLSINKYRENTQETKYNSTSVYSPQQGGQLEIVTDIGEAVTHSLHAPIQQLHHIRDNSHGILQHYGELAKTAQPLVSGFIMAPCDIANFTQNKVCGTGWNIPCSLSNLYAKAVCLPTSYVNRKLRTVLGKSQTGGGTLDRRSYQYIYEPTTGKLVRSRSRRGTRVLLHYLHHVLQNNPDYT